jgi:hypothetical protein
MKIGRHVKVGRAGLLIAALVALGGGVPLLIAALSVFGGEASAQIPTPSPSPTRTPAPLSAVHTRLKRPGESPVIPSLGFDVWRFSAEVPLPINFDPNLKPIDVTMAVPDGPPHVNPLHVQQLHELRTQARIALGRPVVARAGRQRGQRQLFIVVDLFPWRPDPAAAPRRRRSWRPSIGDRVFVGREGAPLPPVTLRRTREGGSSRAMA